MKKPWPTWAICSLPFLSSLLLALAFSHYHLGWVALVGLVPLLEFWHLAQQKRISVRLAVLLVWSAGMLFYGLNLLWVLDTDPTSWAAIQGVPATLGLAVAWGVMVLGMALTWLIFAALVQISKVALLSRFGLLVVSGSWVVGEWLRGWVVSVMALGPGGTLGTHWNFGSLGFAASATPLIYLGRLAGLLGLAAAVIAVNYSLWLLLHKRFKLPVAVLASLLALCLLSYGVFAHGNGRETKVGVVRIADLGSDYLPELAQRTQGQPQVDLLVLPEYSFFYDAPAAERQVITSKTLLAPAGHTVTSSPVKIDGKKLTEIQYRDSHDSIAAAQYKTFLIPIGEYLPKVIELFLNIAANPEEIARYQEARVINKGTQPEEPVTLNGVSYGALSCSGILSPQLYRHLARQNAQVLVNMASLDIFASSQLYFEQAKAMARFSAVANNKPLVQSSRAGQGYVIDQTGKFVVETTEAVDYKTAQVTPSSARTPYTMLGEWTVPVAFIGLLAVRVKRRRA